MKPHLKTPLKAHWEHYPHQADMGVRGEGHGLSSACHGAGRRMSWHAAKRKWRGRAVTDELAARGITIRSASDRGVAEEAPGAYKDVSRVVEVTHSVGLARKVALLRPLACIKG